MDIQKKRQALIRSGILADTRAVGKTRKLARLRGFPLPSLGHRWPMARPTQPGPIPREPGAFPCPPSGPCAPPLHMELGEPLSISQVAELIGCSPWTVRQALIRRGIPHFRFTASGRLIFYRDQIIRWIEDQQQQGGQKTK